MDRTTIVNGLKSGSIQLDSSYGKHDTFGVPQSNGKALKMFMSCKLCFFTSKVRNTEGGRHLGTSNIIAHVSKCPKREGQAQPKINQFVTTIQSPITASEKEELKKLLLTHVVEGMHSFHSVEEATLQELVQLGVRMGQRHPGCNISTDWAGRRTIARTVLARYEEMEALIKEKLEYPLQNNCISLTTDIWTDNVRKRVGVRPIY